ncbi:MAG TPA: hypothetical protein VG826_03250 [Pirellulales bacterium]|nr:hypothetical protein [Pirellulales bacterium]
MTDVGALDPARKAGGLYEKPPMPDAAFDKILAGAVETDELKNNRRALLRRQGIVP